MKVREAPSQKVTVIMDSPITPSVGGRIGDHCHEELIPERQISQQPSVRAFRYWCAAEIQ